MGKKMLSTKERIIEESILLFAKHGFHSTTFQQIADAVGITQPGVFVHFKTKQILFVAMRNHVASLNHQFVDDLVHIKDDARTALQKHCEGNLMWVIQNKHLWQISLLLYYFACHDKEMKALNQKSLNGGEERILKYVYAGVREQLFHLDDPILVTKEIHSYLIGQAIKYLSADAAPTKNDITKAVSHFLNNILDLK